mgnify:CR=1 FL=1
MSSEIKVSSVKSKTGSDAITIADDGHIQNALTLDGGIANAGTISAGSIGSSVTGFTGFKVVDVWYLDSHLAGSQDPIEAQNYTRASASNGGANFGTGMTLNGTGSNDGTFHFPQTGIWRVDAFFSLSSDGANGSRFQFCKIRYGTGGTSGSSPTIANARANLPAAEYGSTTYGLTTTSTIVDVTTSGSGGSIIKFGYSPTGQPVLTQSENNELFTFFVFSRLGDT